MQMQMRPKYNKPHLKRKKEREKGKENSKFQLPNSKLEWMEEPTMVWVEKYSKAECLWSEEWKKRWKEWKKKVWYYHISMPWAALKPKQGRCHFWMPAAAPHVPYPFLSWPCPTFSNQNLLHHFVLLIFTSIYQLYYLLIYTYIYIYKLNYHIWSGQVLDLTCAGELHECQQS